ncbi:MAG: delta-60 repeat domain-containing protein [Ardenticatenaceae bacterium]|nr:delta-60 repeat domain-containing protein [Ardenticatenaceae bacterium]
MMKRRIIFLFCLLLTVYVTRHQAISAASEIGQLDPSFNDDGLLGTLPAATFNIYDVLVQSDGKALIVGEANTKIFVMRLTPAGFADTSFGALGMVIIDLGPQGYGGAIAKAAGLQADGKIVIGAYAAHSQTLNDWVLLRLNPNGSLDTTFDSDGVVALSAASNDILTDLDIQPNGRITATGFYIDSGGQSGVSVVRWLSNGQLDSSFDGDGIWGTPSDTLVINPQLAVQPDGRLVVAGDNRLGLAPTNDFFVIRLLNNGALDTTFSLVGSTYITADNSEESLGDLMLEPNGSIVLVGDTRGGSTEGVTIVRLLSSGALDSSFNGDGLLTVDVNGTQSAVGTGVARQADGKIVVVGEVDHFSILPGSFVDSFAMRLTANGQLDAGFASGGVLIHDVGQPIGGQSGLWDRASAVTVQPDGKILAAGRVINGGLNYGYLMRLQGQATVFLPMITR